MARARTSFVCAECGQAEPKWQGRCPGCGAWNTMAEERPARGPVKRAPAGAVRALRDVDAVAVRRLATGSLKLLCLGIQDPLSLSSHGLLSGPGGDPRYFGARIDIHWHAPDMHDVHL